MADRDSRKKSAGKYSLYQDPKCTGKEAETTITLEEDGSFTCPPVDGKEQYGKWDRVKDTIILRFDSKPQATYSGTVEGDSISGFYTDFEDSWGCWRAKRVPAVKPDQKPQTPAAPDSEVSKQ